MTHFDDITLFAVQAGYGRLIPIRDGAEVKLIGYNHASPGSYSVFDPDTLTSTTHAFADALRIDFASNSPVLDSDGVTFNGACLATISHGRSNKSPGHDIDLRCLHRLVG